MHRPNFKSVAFPVPETIAIGVLGRVAYAGRMGREWHHPKERC